MENLTLLFFTISIIWFCLCTYYAIYLIDYVYMNTNYPKLNICLVIILYCMLVSLPNLTLEFILP